MINHIVKYAGNYRSRHANNVNMALHVIGVPEALFGVFQIITGHWKWGVVNFCLGYLWQIIGHVCIEKNEVGELIGLKNIIVKFVKK